MRNCFTGSVPQYFKAYCISVSSIIVVPPFGHHLGSAWGHLFVPQTRTSLTQSRSFAIVGPSNWNNLTQLLTEL